MIDDPAAREADTIDAWFAAAREKQSRYVGGAPPFVAQSARIMARCLPVAPARAEALLPSMAFWQTFLPSVLGSDPGNFTAVADRLPLSFRVVHRRIAELRGERQLVYAAFHMAAFPLVAAMIAAAERDEHGRPGGHVLVARRNLGWLRLPAGRWVPEVSHVVSTDRRGLRELDAGLRDGSIRRLLILVDGPHPPGRPGTQAVGGVAPGLGFKTGLLNRLLTLQIPVLPLTHVWTSNRLSVEWRPPLPAAPGAGAIEVAKLIESLLLEHPEQWLNWSAAGLKACTTQGFRGQSAGDTR